MDHKFNDSSTLKSSAHVDFNDKSLKSVRFVEVNSLPAVPGPLKLKLYVDKAICSSLEESSLLGLDQDEKVKLVVQDSILLNSTSKLRKTIIEKATKAYVDSSSENNRNIRDLSTVFNDKDKEIDSNKLTNFNSSTGCRNPSFYNELSNEK